MSTTLIIGYADANGIGGAKVVAGPEMPPDKQNAILEAAKARHIFPEGVKRLEFHILGDPADVEAFISEEVARFKQAGHQASLKLREAQHVNAADERESSRNFTAAHGVFQKAARERNEAIAAVAVQRNILAGALEKDKPAILKKIEALEPASVKATEEFNAVLAQFNIVRNQKSTPGQRRAALVAMGLIKS